MGEGLKQGINLQSMEWKQNGGVNLVVHTGFRIHHSNTEHQIGKMITEIRVKTVVLACIVSCRCSQRDENI